MGSTDPRSQLQFSQVSVDLILPLRHRMLRQGMPFESARFPGDADDATVHFAAVQTVDEKAVCCLTLMAAEW